MHAAKEHWPSVMAFGWRAPHDPVVSCSASRWTAGWCLFRPGALEAGSLFGALRRSGG